MRTIGVLQDGQQGAQGRGGVHGARHRKHAAANVDKGHGGPRGEQRTHRGQAIVIAIAPGHRLCASRSPGSG